MQRLITESRIEHSQETDLPVHGAAFWISTENAAGLRNLSSESRCPCELSCMRRYTFGNRTTLTGNVSCLENTKTLRVFQDQSMLLALESCIGLKSTVEPSLASFVSPLSLVLIRWWLRIWGGKRRTARWLNVTVFYEFDSGPIRVK